MKKVLRRAGLFAACLVTPLAVQAADHRDGPGVRALPAADINDVMAWMSADASKVNLIMTVWPAAGSNATFSDEVQYTFHTASAAGYGQASVEQNVECSFSASQQISCSINGVTVAGDASAETGIESPNGDIKVFAGLRRDPFFFNLAGFQATTETVVGAAGGLSFDDDGCPALDAATSNVLVTQLATAPDGGPAEDFFAPLNTLAIVMQVDKTLLTRGGSILSVWGSTQSIVQ